MEKRVLLEKRGRESNQVRSFVTILGIPNISLKIRAEKVHSAQNRIFIELLRKRLEKSFGDTHFRCFKVRENWIINDFGKKNAFIKKHATAKVTFPACSEEISQTSVPIRNLPRLLPIHAFLKNLNTSPDIRYWLITFFDHYESALRTPSRVVFSFTANAKVHLYQAYQRKYFQRIARHFSPPVHTSENMKVFILISHCMRLRYPSDSRQTRESRLKACRKFAWKCKF